MPYWPPDSPPPAAGVPQMPAAGSGPAPVPYEGPGWALAPDMLGALYDVSPHAMPGDDVMAGVSGANYVTSSPLAAPNINPYEAGAIDPVVCGESHMGPESCDIVSATPGGAVAAAQARADSRQLETFGQGSVIGDLMTFGPGPLDPGAGPGVTDPAGHYYDPPRSYGDEPA
jgi:hypothetical protein